MAVVAASWVRPPCAALAPRVAQKFEAKYSLSLCLCNNPNLGFSSRALQRRGWENSRGPVLRGPLGGSVVKASADDNMDDEGVVKDMERYLNELSVEYENVWDTKPVWCQPWTIVLTGVIGISLSWLVIKSTVVTGIVVVLVAAWWYLFLYTYPLAYTEMIAERRRKQKNGSEDTFGLRTRKE